MKQTYIFLSCLRASPPQRSTSFIKTRYKSKILSIRWIFINDCWAFWSRNCCGASVVLGDIIGVPNYDFHGGFLILSRIWGLWNNLSATISKVMGFYKQLCRMWLYRAIPLRCFRHIAPVASHRIVLCRLDCAYGCLKFKHIDGSIAFK